MNDSSPVPQRKHGGKILTAIACRHIVRAVESMSGRHVGYHIDPLDRKPLPDAWCTACDKALSKAGGKWTAEVLARAGFQEMCPCCYDFALPGSIVESVRWR